MANLRTNIMDFRGFDSSIILNVRGGILMSIGNFPVKFESSNLSRDNVSREIGCTLHREHRPHRRVPSFGRRVQMFDTRRHRGGAPLLGMDIFYPSPFSAQDLSSIGTSWGA